MAKDLIREEITPEEVRYVTGADEDLISEDNLKFLIRSARRNFENYLNTKFTPTEEIEIQERHFTDGRQINLQTEKTPVLNTYRIKIGDRDLTNFRVDKEAGVIQAYGLPDIYTNIDLGVNLGIENSIRINYLYGYVEKDEAEKSFLTEDIEPGDEVTVKVDNVENVTTDEWVWIIGMDGNEEVCEVKTRSKSDNEFVLKKVTRSHEKGSLIYRVRVSEAIRSLILYEVATRVSIEATGGTYTFNTTYSLGEMSVSKGVPYTHWAKVYEQAKQKRDEILNNIVRPRYHIA